MILHIMALITIGIILVMIGSHNYFHKRRSTEVTLPERMIESESRMRLTMKSVIRWEQLRQKSFRLMDYSMPEDIEALLYTVAVCNGIIEGYTFDVFRQTLTNESITRELASALEREASVLKQFQKQEEGIPEESKDAAPDLIGNIVSTLIMEGLDARYVLEDMALCDLPMFIEAHGKKRKESMEESRLWTYFSILPHIDSSKLKNGARDLIIFPWEEQQARKQAQQAISENMDSFEKFMKMNKSDFIK